MTFKVYATDTSDPTLQWERAVFDPAGVEVILADCTSEADVAERCHDADALLVGNQHIGAVALAGLLRCQLIVRLGIGVDVIDVDACTERGILVANVPDYCVAEVSDHALALVLAMARRVLALDSQLRAGDWALSAASLGMRRLSTQTLGVIGLGRIGMSIVRKAKAFGFTTIGTDPYLSGAAADEAGVVLMPFDELLAQADVVVVSCPLTAATRHLVDADAFTKMKRAATLVNVSRGPIVDELALISALQNGDIGGAALDVFETEPLDAGSPLRNLPNVILTPHAAHHSVEAHADLHTRAAQEVVRVFTGNEPMSLLNPEAKAHRAAASIS